MDSGTSIHVMPTNDHWMVRDARNPLELSRHGTRQEAIIAGRAAARERRAALLVHDQDGNVELREDWIE